MITKGQFLFKGYEYKEGGRPFEIDGRKGVTKDKYRIKCDEIRDNDYNECYVDVIKDNNVELFNKIPSLLADVKAYTKLELTFDLNISKNAHTLVDIQPIVK